MRNMIDNFKKLLMETRSLILETAMEEAWELLGQKNPIIQNYVKEKGLSYDEESVKKLIPIIEKLPTIKVDYNQIKNFENLERPKTQGFIKRMYDVSKSENPKDEFIKAMTERDTGEDRNRGYDTGLNFDRIVKGDYEPPLVLKKDNKYYVVGGRTRIYASLAANVPIKILVIE